MGNVFAQSLTAVAVNREINDSAAVAGNIISVASDGSLKRSAVDYDSAMVGVIVDAPILSVEPKSDKTKAVATSGEAQVKVNGNVSAGDFLTSSKTAGVAQKATDSGYVLGKALKAGGSDSLVNVQIEIGYRQVGASATAVSKGFLGTIVSDPAKLKLSFAMILAAIILTGGIVAFIRMVNSGVVAIGRNPLARAQIMRSMFVSGFVVVLIMALGFGAAAAIIFLGK